MDTTRMDGNGRSSKWWDTGAMPGALARKSVSALTLSDRHPGSCGAPAKASVGLIEAGDCLNESIFDFWAEVPLGSKIHPKDEDVLRRNFGAHDLQLDCLPCSFNGPLRTAKLVLLFLNPGFHDTDLDHAKSDDGKSMYFRQWTGDAALPTSDEHGTAARWATQILKQFELSHAEASFMSSIMNLMPYHSVAFKYWGLLSSLPSTRATIGWAQDHLFKRAKEKEVVVVCLRSATQWGLRRGMVPEGYLFAPTVSRGGHVCKMTGERGAIIDAIRDVFGR